MENNIRHYRGKRKDNGTWIYGNLSIIPNTLQEAKIEAGYYISNSAGMPLAYAVRPETVGQYTGRKDKNNKEIYQGDRLLIEYNRIGIIEVKWDVVGKWNIANYALEHSSLLDNIHDNPEKKKTR